MYADKKRILETFLELVKVYSPSKNEENLAKLIIEKISLLGLSPERDEFGNIIGRMPAKEGIEAPIIFFSAHLDVVEPCKDIQPVIEEIDGTKVIKSSGNTVLGADDKAGLAMIIEAITSVIEKDLPHGEIELVLTLQEENGLVGSKAVDLEALSSKFGYILDHSAPVGTAINRAPQHDNLTFVFKGKAAHSGLQPEEGINAILVAAKAILNMPIGSLDDDTTANVGTIKGGHSTNIIPDECIITCEVRSHNVKHLTRFIEQYIEAANNAVTDIPGTSVSFSRDTEYKALHVQPEEDLLQYAKKAAEAMNLPFNIVSTCGGSDANVFNHKGLPSVCLGCGYHNPHATNEYITLDDLALGADYVISIMQAVIKNNEDQ